MDPQNNNDDNNKTKDVKNPHPDKINIGELYDYFNDILGDLLD